MADDQQAQDTAAALHLTNALLADVDAYLGRQPGGEMPVAVVADGVAGLAGSVAASGAKQLRAAGEAIGAEQLPLEMCRVLLGMQGSDPDDASDAPLRVGALNEAEGEQATTLRQALEALLDARAEQETLSIEVVFEAVTDLLLRTILRVALQLAEAGDPDAARMQLIACGRLVQRSLDTLAAGDIEAEDGT